MRAGSIQENCSKIAKGLLEPAIELKSGKAQLSRKLLKQLCSNPRLLGQSIEYCLEKTYATLLEMKGKRKWRTRSDSNARPSGSKPDALSN